MTAGSWGALGMAVLVIALISWIYHLRQGSQAILSGYRMGADRFQIMESPGELEAIADRSLIAGAAQRVLGREIEALAREGTAVSALVRRREILEGRREFLSDTAVVRIRGELGKRQLVTEKMLRQCLGMSGLQGYTRAVVEDIARTGLLPKSIPGIIE